jgi:hypothetical protein
MLSYWKFLPRTMRYSGAPSAVSGGKRYGSVGRFGHVHMTAKGHCVSIAGGGG